MGLCLADTLIALNDLDETQLMVSFSDWWHHGYNNAFTGDKPKGSVGLGGNISQSMNQYQRGRNATGPCATAAGDKNTSGNGSLMRLGPIALFAKTLNEARDLARSQSFVTHQGEEAAACCELMVTLLFTALHHSSKDPKEVKAAAFASLNTFACSVTSVNELAQSLTSPTQAGENWNWKDPNFKFHPQRLQQQPGYIGSYAMDGLAMALHWIWKTDTFEEVICGTGFRGGDADTVAAIAGQIAGAIYGYQNIPSEWVQDVQTWDRGGEIATRAHLLLSSHQRNGPIL
jgi:ADP-ribosylglycohydrolase